jgi:hypothetical protein
VGEVSGSLLAELARSANVAVARAPAEPADEPAGAQASAERPERPAWERGALAMREAARRQATYVIVADDPLADVAAQWRAMWDLSAATGGAEAFEIGAAAALGAWRGKRFDLPDYYLVVAPALDGAGPDLYLGPLRAARPRRVAVAVAGLADNVTLAARLLDTLRSLEHGPWWPPLDGLLDVARTFYAGDLVATSGDGGGGTA